MTADEFRARLEADRHVRTGPGEGGD